MSRGRALDALLLGLATRAPGLTRHVAPWCWDWRRKCVAVTPQMALCRCAVGSCGVCRACDAVPLGFRWTRLVALRRWELRGGCCAGGAVPLGAAGICRKTVSLERRDY